MAKRTPTKGELKAAKIIGTAFRKVLNNLGYPDEMNNLPKEIERIAQVIADNREAS